MSDILDDRIADARRRASRGEAEDTDWHLLITDRQCRKLDEITRMLHTLMDDRHRWVIVWRVGISAIGISGFALAVSRALGAW